MILDIFLVIKKQGGKKNFKKKVNKSTTIVMGIQIRHYDVKTQMPRDASVVLLGARRAGKSRTIRYLLREMNFRVAVAFVGSAEAETFYEDFLPKSYVHGKYNSKKILDILNWQKFLKKVSLKLHFKPRPVLGKTKSTRNTNRTCNYY